MEKLKKFSRKEKRINLITITAFLLICLIMGFVCFLYYERLQETVKDESNGYMEEISKQISINVSKTMNDNFSVLSTIESVLQNLEVSSYEQLQSVMTEQQGLWNYQHVMLLDENGTAYDTQGKVVALSNDTYLQEAIVNKKPSMSTSQVIDGVECIVFATPLQDVKIGEANMVALATSYTLSTFDQMLSMTAFDGKGYAHIIRKDGTIVIRSSSENAGKTGYNILNTLSDTKSVDEKKMNDIRSAIANGENGHTELTIDNARTYMIYTPLTSQEWSLLTFVPETAINQKSNMLLQITLLLCSFITIAFSLLLGSLMLTFYKNKRKLERIAYVDSVTGGNTRERFIELADVILSASNKPQYAMIYANIEKFKVLNEQFGKKACDEVLCSFVYGVNADLDEDECMGRLFADNFCILVKFEDEAKMVERFTTWQKGSISYIENNGSAWLPLIIEFGVFVIDNDTLPLAHMVDRAKLSLSEAVCKLYGKLRYAIYDERVRRVLFREKQLEDMMEEALSDKEFQVYLQPKYNTQTEKIGGAEALVRWVSKSEGMIFPDEFISLFEKNGFIIQLDLFVFEEVCRTLRRWLDEGKTPVKISVNCSRMHLKNATFLQQYKQVAQKYALPVNSIEIELTENTVFEDVEYLSKIIRDIHAAGFGCSMDDFGSGYSSLNLIQDIPVDTIKLDKIFFRTSSRDIRRTESVVGSIITMTKALNMETVAEGVEEREQVDMLKRLNCDYIQGYFFAKPMPIDNFEQIAFPDKIQSAADKVKE